jgi:protein gp37
MPTRTAIEWTDYSSNPIKFRRQDTGKVGWHCEKISPGCAHCYSEVIDGRFGTQLDYTRPNSALVEPFVVESELRKLLGLKGPVRVFLGDMTDLFLDLISDAMLDRVFTVMAYRRDVTFQVLTKRPGRMCDYVRNADGREFRAEIPGVRLDREPFDWPPPNVHLGVSVEDQRRADERIPHLLETPAAVRFLSVEPMLGPVDLFCVNAYADGHTNALRGVTIGVTDGLGAATGFDHSRIDWVIAGGESGHGARPVHPEWVRSIRDQCVATGVPFFFKQYGEWLPLSQIGDDAPSPRGAPLAYLNTDGRMTRAISPYEPGCPCDHMPSEIEIVRVGKKAAGRMLDGRTWDETPAAGRGRAVAP